MVVYPPHYDELSTGQADEGAQLISLCSFQFEGNCSLLRPKTSLE